MVHAFVLLSVSAGAAGKLVPMVRAVESVSEAYVVSGDYDVVAEVEAEEVFDVLSLVTRELRPLDGVESTRTYIALE